ncbi:MAG TPA: hypothetical protein ENL20_03120 [Candidatus Cloacimonetes bacterium]|nr:hypothetical protein [Candidatus Cloacimonadota bacterium]
MKKTIVTIIAALALLSMLAAFERPCGRFGYPEGGGKGSVPFNRFEESPSMFEELELTDDQIERMESIRTEFQKKNIKLHSDIEVLEIDKLIAIRNENYDEAKTLMDQIFEIRKELAKNHLEMIEKKNEILTPEQKEIADKFRYENRFFNNRFQRDKKGRKGWGKGCH